MMLKYTIYLLMILFSYGCADKRDDSTVSIAFMGDSTSMGFGANGGPDVWPENGLSYYFSNYPNLSPNNDPNSKYFIGSDFPYISQEHQDDTGIPSSVRLLRTEIEKNNEGAKIYNYSGSGWTASTHIQYETTLEISKIMPKPDFVLINLGINSAKNNSSHKKELTVIVERLLFYDITPVLVKPHNIAVAYSSDGIWSEIADPDDWYPMDNWPQIRKEIDEVSKEYNIGIIDLGSDDETVDIKLLYDPFDPNKDGYNRIYKIYLKWFEKQYS